MPLDLACFVWSSLCSSTSCYFVFVLLAVNAVLCCDLCVHLGAAISVRIAVFVAHCKLMFFLCGCCCFSDQEIGVVADWANSHDSA